MRGLAAFDEALRVLEPHGLSLGWEVAPGFERTAGFVDAWERLAPWVEFDSVVVRCHWHALCSSICRTARQRGKPAIAFQQGVICHTLDVPVTSSKFVAFGPSSASFLARMNRRFFEAAGSPEPLVEYVSGGSLFDTITALPNQFARQTVLMLDVPNAQSEFYGLESLNRAVLQLTERLLTADLPLRRMVIRPHPYWSNLDLEPCLRLMREHPGRCELSHPSVPLADDLARSSAVFGIFSGVLSVASASGLPTVFVETEGGYTTGDLACFSRQAFLPDAAFAELAGILRDPRAYAEARAKALQNGRDYYANGTNADLNAAFFERLLERRPRQRGPAA